MEYITKNTKNYSLKVNKYDEKKYIQNYNNYKILLKDFLTPFIKEENIRQLLSYYQTKYCQNKNRSTSLKKSKKK